MIWDEIKAWFHDLKHDDDPHSCEVTVHSVQKGDTLIDLAGKDDFHKVVELNPKRQWDDKYTIYVGEKLRIPKSWAS